jgi:hypothetical protein
MFGSIRCVLEATSFDVFRQRHEAMKANLLRVEAEIQRQYAEANTLDLVIVMDCTGSVDPWIEAAKTSLLSIIDNVKATHHRATVRVAFVAYRDFCDNHHRLEVHGLTEDVGSVRAFISGLTAFGGGDGPEDIPGGLDAALKMEFTAAAKRLILVADAPYHGGEFHDKWDDPDSLVEAAAGPDIREQMRMLARRGIDFTFIEIVPTATAKMVTILQQEYQTEVASDGVGQEFRMVSLSQSGDAVRFGPVVASSASSSLSGSKMRSVVASSEKVFALSSLEHYGPSGRETTSLPGIREGDDDVGDDYISISRMRALDWADLDDAPAIPAVRHSYYFRQGQDIDWAHLDLKHTTQETTIRLLPDSFARGAMRSAHAMYDMKMGKRFVAKFYYGRAAADVTRAKALTGWSLENDVKAQVVAKRLAVEFSLLPEARDGVDFIFTSWYEIQDPEAAGLDVAMAAFTAEPYIAGEYKKYNNNNGWVRDGGVAQLRDAAQAFSHFTWQRTLGRLMVVDLQGVGCIFTDPQIHSMDPREFGRGNSSEAGMAAFFCTHKCNDICAALGLLSCSASDLVGASEDGASDDAVYVTSTEQEDKLMTCSCGLCGEILQVARSAFVKAYSKEREVFCGDCSAKVAVREARECVVCDEAIQVATYWYDMKGMKQPTSCKKCKAVAATMDRRARGSE